MKLVQMNIDGYVNAQRFVMMSLGILFDGGPGSGNFGHEGRPGEIGGSGSGGARSMNDFLPNDSYTERPEYKDAVKKIKECVKKGQELHKKEDVLKEKIKKESRPKPESEWTDEDELESLLGNTPRVYTKEGEKLKKELDKVEKDIFDNREESDDALARTRSIKELERDKQLRDYKQKELVPAGKDDEYEGFTLEKTSNSFGDEYLKNGKGELCEMSPREYLERCAYEIFSGTMESTIGAIDKETAEKYAEQMKAGAKFDLPYLNYKDSGQEGRHRAMAAYLNGVDKIPVLIIGKPPVMDRADAEDPDWITIKGQHIPIDPDTGAAIGGNPKVLGEENSEERGRGAEAAEARIKRGKVYYSRAEYRKFARDAQKIASSYIFVSSLWNGTITIDNKYCNLLHADGVTTPDGEIIVTDTTHPSVVIHEMLHTHSYLHDPDAYPAFRDLEEGTVDYLTKLICKKKGINFKASYTSNIEALEKIVRVCKVKNEFRFAVGMIEQKLSDRPAWLRDIIEKSYKTGKISADEYLDVMEESYKVLGV